MSQAQDRDERIALAHRAARECAIERNPLTERQLARLERYALGEITREDYMREALADVAEMRAAREARQRDDG